MNKPSIFTNKAIFASAGTGKTFQLTDRFIYILHHTLEPEKIIALTFTRAASGEFFHKIVEKLYLASTDKNIAKELSKRLQITADQEHYKKLLKTILQQLHRLNLQTLDSFLYKILNCYGPEIGLTDSVQLLSDNSRKLYQKKVRDSILYEFKPSEDKDNSLKQFWHAFKQSNYGESINTIDKTIQNYIETIQDYYYEAPTEKKWGSIETIWSNQYPWMKNPLANWSELSEQLMALTPKDLNKSVQKAFLSAANFISTYPSNKKPPVLIERSLQNFEALEKGKALIKIGNSDLLIEGATANALYECIKNIFNYHIQRSTESTQGTFRILEMYNKAYDTQVRQSGKVTFSDLIHILNPNSSLSPLQGESNTIKDLLYYRLDAHYDHWLFDEFQDTSRSQWEIIKDLVDEAIQDDERTAFFVGDTKQSLYLWRNSDDRLFQSICDYYDKAIAKPDTLSVSFRSAPAIMDAVNRVFDDRHAILDYFGSITANRWFRAWEKHTASAKTESLQGYASWINVSQLSKSNKEASILNILKGLRDKSDNLSIAILVSKNSEALELAYFLREQGLGIPIRVGSASYPAKDNAAGIALIAMLKYCLHPSDEKSRHYLGLIDVSTNQHSLISTVDKLRPQANAMRSAQLVLKFSQALINKLTSCDQRHRKSLYYLIENAEKFDREETPSIKDLIPYLENFNLNESQETSVVTIETIHRSKGLEYDVVLFINNNKTNLTEKNIKAFRNNEQEIQWVLEPFKKELMHSLNKSSDFIDQIQEENQFSSLCKLYVAMTRAKRALYMITDLDRVHSNTPVDFLKTHLGEHSKDKLLFKDYTFSVLWDCGDANWHESIQKNSELNFQKISEKKESAIPAFKPTHDRLNDFVPSRLSEKESIPIRIMSNDTGSNIGKMVHRAFEQIEWYDCQKDLKTQLKNEIDAKTLERIKACFEQKSIQDFFQKPDTACTLWKEKAFTLSENKTLINGIFDRVHIFIDENNHPIKAQIVDFKTDTINEKYTIANAVEKHEKQLEMYQNALSKLLKIDKAKIETYLLFTSAKEIHRLQ